MVRPRYYGDFDVSDVEDNEGPRIPLPDRLAEWISTLTVGAPDENEKVVPERDPATMNRYLPAVQSMPFTELPPELRNRIYEYALMPTGGKDLLVATPYGDEALPYAVQPALTKICRLIRSETIPVFYGINTFVAHVYNCKFEKLINFCKAVGGGESSVANIDPIFIKVVLGSRLYCVYDLLPLAQAWSSINHGRFRLDVSLQIPSWYVSVREPFDHCRVVVKAVEAAEKLNDEGVSKDGSLLPTFTKAVKTEANILECSYSAEDGGCSHCPYFCLV